MHNLRALFPARPKSLIYSIDTMRAIPVICVFKRCLKNVFVAGTNPLADQKPCGTAIVCFVSGQSRIYGGALQSITQQVCSAVALYSAYSSRHWRLFQSPRTLLPSGSFHRWRLGHTGPSMLIFCRRARCYGGRHLTTAITRRSGIHRRTRILQLHT